MENNNDTKHIMQLLFDAYKEQTENEYLSTSHDITINDVEEYIKDMGISHIGEEAQKLNEQTENPADTIHISWCIEDVQGRAAQMDYDIPTDEEARDILGKLERNHDCNHGITWDHIDVYLHDLVRERKLSTRLRKVIDKLSDMPVSQVDARREIEELKDIGIGMVAQEKKNEG